MVKTTGRTSRKSFNVSQKIVVGNREVMAEVKSAPVVSAPVVKKKVEVIKPIPVKKSPERASSTLEIKETVALAAVVYTAPPKTSALESFLWLPRKIWGAVSSIFKL